MPKDSAAAQNRQRLDKWVSSQGSWSRRQVKELVRAGKILVNGTPPASSDVKISEADEVWVDGKRLFLQKHVYIMLNKPAGVVSATEDKQDKTVLDLLPPDMRRPGLFPAGRLDKDAEGFVLITDDGAFAHSILSPVHHVPKTYYVQFVPARQEPDCTPQELIAAFAAGVPLGEGEESSPAQLVLLPPEDGQDEKALDYFVAELTIYEGIFHQVKRMFMRFGFRVAYLRRVRIGGLDLDKNLRPGAARVIVHNELLEIC